MVRRRWRKPEWRLRVYRGASEDVLRALASDADAPGSLSGRTLLMFPSSKVALEKLLCPVSTVVGRAGAWALVLGEGSELADAMREDHELDARTAATVLEELDAPLHSESRLRIIAFLVEQPRAIECCECPQSYMRKVMGRSKAHRAVAKAMSTREEAVL